MKHHSKKIEIGERMLRFRLILMCVLSMATSVVCSQTDSIVGKVHTVDEVVVQSKNIDTNILSSTPTQTMSSERMNALGIISLADAVKKFAGAGVRDYGGIGGLKTVSVRNLGAHHTMVSYDGIAVSNAQAGQVDISRFTTDNLSKLSFCRVIDSSYLCTCNWFMHLIKKGIG